MLLPLLMPAAANAQTIHMKVTVRFKLGHRATGVPTAINN
jgi:hypothetical protein